MDVNCLKLLPEDIPIMEGSRYCAFCIPVPQLYLEENISIDPSIYPTYEGVALKILESGFVQSMTLNDDNAVQIYLEESGRIPLKTYQLSGDKELYYGRSPYFAVHNVGSEKNAKKLVGYGVEVLNLTLDYVAKVYPEKLSAYLEEKGLVA